MIFSSNSHLREINGFQHCTSLCRLEIPSTIERIGWFGFLRSTSLNKMIFSSNSHLREIDRFQHCTSLRQIDIPSSIETIGNGGFFGYSTLRLIVIHARCRMRKSEGLQNIKIFLSYEEDNDVKECGRLAHLAVSRK
jgi:hypothetical protein